MAPTSLRPRQSLAKDKFASHFGALKGQYYTDTTSSARGNQPPSRSDSELGLIRSIAWSPLGNLVATGSADRTLRVWNPEKAHVRFSTELKGHSATICKVAFNPVKDAELCSVSEDGTVKFWDVRTKNCVNEVKGLGEACSLVWAPDGSSLIVGNKSNNIFTISPTLSEPVSSHQQNVRTNQIAFTWKGDRVFATTGVGSTRILTYPEFKPAMRYDYPMKAGESDEFVLRGHTSSAVSVELSPTGRWLATGGTDSMIALYDTQSWLCSRTITKIAGPVRSLSFTFDGSYIAGGSEGEAGVHISHVETGEHVHTIKTAGNCPFVSWAPTKYCLAYSDTSVNALRIVGVDTDKR